MAVSSRVIQKLHSNTKVYFWLLPYSQRVTTAGSSRSCIWLIFFPCWMPLLTQSQRNRTVHLCLLGECVNHYTIKLTSTKNHSWIRSLRFAAVQYQQCRVHPLQLTYNFTHQCCRQAVTRPLPSLVAEHVNSSWQHWATCYKEFWEFSKAPVQQH